jgi:hypothetical protein
LDSASGLMREVTRLFPESESDNSGTKRIDRS